MARILVPPQGGKVSWTNFGKPVADAINEFDATISTLGGELLDGMECTVQPCITITTGSETNIPRMRLGPISVTSGSLYVFQGQFTRSVTVTDTEADFYIREDTALSGAIVKTNTTLTKNGRVGREYSGVANANVQYNWWIPWTCYTPSAAKYFHFSLLRTAGTGNIQVDGLYMFHGIYRVSRNSSIFRTVST